MSEYSPFFEITPECNLRCSYCFYTDKMEEYPDFEPEYMDLSVIKAVYEAGWEPLGHAPGITGGEPFLHPDIEEILRYLDDIGAPPAINSNLIPIREDQYDLISETVRQVNTTIDHVHAEKHDGQRGGFGAVLETLEDLVTHGISVGVTCVITKNNYQDIGEIYEELIDLDVDSLFFQPAYLPHDDSDLTIDDLPEAEKEELVSALEPWAETFGFERNLEILADLLLDQDIPEERCVMGESRFVVYHDGTVQPCFHRHDLFAGDVTTTEPSAVMDEMVAQADTIRNEDCFNSACVCFF